MKGDILVRLPEQATAPYRDGVPAQPARVTGPLGSTSQERDVNDSPSARVTSVVHKDSSLSAIQSAISSPRKDVLPRISPGAVKGLRRRLINSRANRTEKKHRPDPTREVTSETTRKPKQLSEREDPEHIVYLTTDGQHDLPALNDSGTTQPARVEDQHEGQVSDARGEQQYRDVEASRKGRKKRADSPHDNPEQADTPTEKTDAASSEGGDGNKEPPAIFEGFEGEPSDDREAAVRIFGPSTIEAIEEILEDIDRLDEHMDFRNPLAFNPGAGVDYSLLDEEGKGVIKGVLRRAGGEPQAQIELSHETRIAAKWHLAVADRFDTFISIFNTLSPEINRAYQVHLEHDSYTLPPDMQQLLAPKLNEAWRRGKLDEFMKGLGLNERLDQFAASRPNRIKTAYVLEQTLHTPVTGVDQAPQPASVTEGKEISISPHARITVDNLEVYMDTFEELADEYHYPSQATLETIQNVYKEIIFCATKSPETIHPALRPTEFEHTPTLESGSYHLQKNIDDLLPQIPAAVDGSYQQLMGLIAELGNDSMAELNAGLLTLWAELITPQAEIAVREGHQGVAWGLAAERYLLEQLETAAGAQQLFKKSPIAFSLTNFVEQLGGESLNAQAEHYAMKEEERASQSLLNDVSLTYHIIKGGRDIDKRQKIRLNTVAGDLGKIKTDATGSVRLLEQYEVGIVVAMLAGGDIFTKAAQTIDDVHSLDEDSRKALLLQETRPEAYKRIRTLDFKEVIRELHDKLSDHDNTNSFKAVLQRSGFQEADLASVIDRLGEFLSERDQPELQPSPVNTDPAGPTEETIQGQGSEPSQPPEIEAGMGELDITPNITEFTRILPVGRGGRESLKKLSEKILRQAKERARSEHIRLEPDRIGLLAELAASWGDDFAFWEGQLGRQKVTIEGEKYVDSYIVLELLKTLPSGEKETAAAITISPIAGINAAYVHRPNMPDTTEDRWQKVFSRPKWQAERDAWRIKYVTAQGHPLIQMMTHKLMLAVVCDPDDYKKSGIWKELYTGSQRKKKRKDISKEKSGPGIQVSETIKNTTASEVQTILGKILGSDQDN